MTDTGAMAKLKSIPARTGLDWDIEHFATNRSCNQYERYDIRHQGRMIAFITAQTRPGAEPRWRISPMRQMPDIARLIEAEYPTASAAIADLAAATDATMPPPA